MRMLLVLAFAAALAAATYGCGKGKSDSAQTRKIGACEIETIAIGTGMGNADEAPADAAWIRICSVESAGNEIYKKAADDLKALLDARGIKIYSRTQLMHVKEGPCWPPYSIEFRIALAEEPGGRFRTFLLQHAVANHRPLAERAGDYGPFFVSCGRGASDWWAVWYVK